MTEGELREEICRVGASLHTRGYVHGSAGNISVRFPQDEGGGYLMTPTDACLGTLDPARLARTDAQGTQLSGDKISKTVKLHMAIYGACDTAGAPASCIIHTHSTHCVALTLGKAVQGGSELLGALTPYFVMKVGHVPVIPYGRPGDPRVAEEVAQTIASYAHRGLRICAVMLERLGPNVWGSRPASAMAALEELEETARLSLLTDCAAPLSGEQIDELRREFGASW